ncbi:MAG: hypothetical protein OXE48_11315 [Gammaproteobacteria bacterium]|nr:hypothetical protein [Gammaproteobacteria bacterium]
MNFDTALGLFRSERISELGADPVGRRFLKLRSLSRKQYIERLFREVHLVPRKSRAQEMFREAFESHITEERIEKVIRTIDAEQRRNRIENRTNLINELYKLDSFNWGGLHQNNLERTIVDKYVKRIWRYEDLTQKIEGDIHDSLRGYVLCSWYNHWTSILIEDIFRSHAVVLPAIGQVKKIDFFVGQTPFDLKVTYMPEGFLAEKRKADSLRPELTLLKREARDRRIGFDKDLPSARLLEDLWNKIEDSPDEVSKQLIADLRGYRENLVGLVEQNPDELITWLYENQGSRRFDASNRLFLILVDPRDYFASWKLKRAFPLLESRINNYLDGIKENVDREIFFDWDGRQYRALSDMILVRRMETY